jgi:lipopolysaccharide export system permease protein
MLVLAMPIAILISSIMTFGNLSERFELVAIKSAGISLLRFMKPLIVIVIGFCGITFVFANYVIPYANLKFASLYSNIYFQKPAFDLKEGVFFTYIPNYAIKAGKKDSDGKTIHDVLIYEQGNSIQDNCIQAEKGVMQVSSGNNFLEFNLENGIRYQEKGAAYETNTEYTRLEFKKFKKLFDLSILKNNQKNDSAFRGSIKMLSARQLQKNIDSLYKAKDTLLKKMSEGSNTNRIYLINKPVVTKNLEKPVSLRYSQLIPLEHQLAVNQSAQNMIAALRNDMMIVKSNLENNENETKMSLIEWNSKFAISLSCLVLFFLGAPLGAIIKKGGIGLPLVFAIFFFLLFHLLMIFGKNFAADGSLPPFLGMWLPVIVLSPIGMFLTYKAMNDSALFNKEYYISIAKKLSFFSNAKK